MLSTFVWAHKLQATFDGRAICAAGQRRNHNRGWQVTQCSRRPNANALMVVGKSPQRQEIGAKHGSRCGKSAKGGASKRCIYLILLSLVVEGWRPPRYEPLKLRHVGKPTEAPAVISHSLVSLSISAANQENVINPLFPAPHAL